MMLAEPTPHPDAAREKVVELMFETHGPPALYLARDAVLAAFATGRQTALVVDAGHDSTTGECFVWVGGGGGGCCVPPFGFPLFSPCPWRWLPHHLFVFTRDPVPLPGWALRSSLRLPRGDKPNQKHTTRAKHTPVLLLPPQMSSFSMLCLSAWIWLLSWDPSLVVTEHEMTWGRGKGGGGREGERFRALLANATLFSLFSSPLTGRDTPHARPRAALDGTKT